MSNDKQWSEEDWQLWKRRMYLEPLARAQAAYFVKEFERWHTRHLLNSLFHHVNPINKHEE